MAHPQVAEGEDEIQPWKVAANIFNKQSQKAEKRVGLYLLILAWGVKPSGRKNMFGSS